MRLGSFFQYCITRRSTPLALLVGRHYVPPVNLKLASYENTQRGFNMKKDIQTIESKIVYENKWMSVREDKILRTNGHEGIYGVVEKNDFAVIAAIQDQQIYMVQQYRYPVEARFWELPQGSWEKSDILPLELAKAELREETGIIANSMQHVGHLYLAYGYSNQGYDIFYATDLQTTMTALDPEEVDLIARPFSLREVEKMIISGEIKDASTVAVFGLLKMKNII